MPMASEPITIRRYAHRRLYNPSTAAYVSLDDLAAMLEDDEAFVVHEAGSGEDITRLVLKQITVQRGSHG
jgi:polyhydroxyalkanoate synthesis repressor PhaR